MYLPVSFSFDIDVLVPDGLRPNLMGCLSFSILFISKDFTADFI